MNDKEEPFSIFDHPTLNPLLEDFAKCDHVGCDVLVDKEELTTDRRFQNSGIWFCDRHEGTGS